MHDENTARKGLALGLALATVALTGCSESHAMTDAARPAVEDAASGPDASSLALDAAMPDAATPDAGAGEDAALAALDASTPDAATVDAWADLPDAYYPDGVRG